ncbi:MAG TPA: hypothetical protein PLS03_18720 [Terrimicrobiaceae bacterium]|nr:hypothetical protein [Terrimicrobiaceae bacterium]
MIEFRFQEGHFFLSIDDTFVVKARRIQPTSEGLSIDGGKHNIPFEKLTHVWQVGANQSLPLGELEEKTKIGGSLLDLELSMAAYEKETGLPPFHRGDAPVIFGATSLALTVLNERVSDDVDVALDPEFLTWRAGHWPYEGPGFLDAPSIDGLFMEMGHWSRRCSRVAGMSGYEFRILHPLDTAMQKLLRRDSEKFELKDKEDITLILEALRPSQETLIGLLTENPARYRKPAAEVKAHRRHYETVISNTQWFLNTFVPERTVDEIAGLSEQLHEANLEPLSARNHPATLAQAIGAQRIKL